MKLATLLAQYLYSNRQLILPGLGTFTLDPSVSIEQDHPRNKIAHNIEGVNFESNTSIASSPELVQYISSETGKIKALAAADLESHLGLALQFINIGKPFLFEGIGSLAKSVSGGFTFTPGHAIHVKPNTPPFRDSERSSVLEEPATEYKSVFASKNSTRGMRVPGMALLVVAGIGLAVWGGYMVYKKTSAKENEPVVNEQAVPAIEPQPSLLMTDSSADRRDSALPMPADPAVSSTTQGNYKFIVEVADKGRAMQRISTLKAYGIDISMETADSVEYKLFFSLPATPADTARILDSLRIHYTPPGKKAFIE